MFDGWTAEVETLEFLYALVRLIKPRLVLETGTWRGFAAAAMGRALRENGRGKMVTIECDLYSHREAAGLIARTNLLDIVEVIHGSSLEFELSESADFLLFDSDLSIRGAEYEHFRPFFAPGALILFHDTSFEHRVVRDDLGPLFQKGELDGFFLSTPRGLSIGHFRGAQGATESDRAAMHPVSFKHAEAAHRSEDSPNGPTSRNSFFDRSVGKEHRSPGEHCLELIAGFREELIKYLDRRTPQNPDPAVSLWRNLVVAYKYLFDLSPENLRKVRLHSYLFTMLNPVAYWLRTRE